MYLLCSLGMASQTGPGDFGPRFEIFVQLLELLRVRELEQQAARTRARKDRDTYSREELEEIETLYQVANKNWRSPEAIESLEVSLGERSNTLNGLAYGALGGAVLGAGFVAVSCLAEGCSGDDGAGAGGWIAFGAIVGAGGGAVLGLLVGSLVKTETWEDARTRVEPDPTARR